MLLLEQKGFEPNWLGVYVFLSVPPAERSCRHVDCRNSRRGTWSWWRWRLHDQIPQPFSL